MSFIMENGQVRWGGLLLYDDSYTPLPWLETASTPAGLIYQTNHQYFLVGTDGNSTLLVGNEGHLKVSPDGAWAVSGELAQNELGVISLVNGAKSTFPLKGYLMWAVDEAAWLDSHTLLVGLAESHDNANSQGAVGHLALVDLTSGKQQDLSIRVDGYSQPTIAPDGTILYTNSNGILMAWRDGQAQPFPLGTIKLEGKTLDTVSRPAFSPDGKTLVGLTTAWQGNESLPAFILVNLTAHTGQLILTYHGIPTDARIPTKIDWSPDSQWVAIDSIDYDPIQNGVSLVSADGQQRIFLGSGSSDPVWLDSETIVFSYSAWGLTRLQTYNLTTQVRRWLDLPAGVWNQSNGRGLPSVSAVFFPQTLP